MSAPRLIPQEISVRPRVLISPPGGPIAQEIVRQLKLTSSCDVLDSPDNSAVDVFVEIVSPHEKKLQVVCTKKIVVDPATISSPYPKSVAEIISKFIYGYNPPKDEIVTLPVTKSAPLPVLIDEKKVVRKSFWSKYFLLFLILPFFPWVMLIIQGIFLAALTACTINTYSPSCAHPAAKISEFMIYQLPAAYGSREVLTSLGYPPSLITAALQDLSDSSANLYQLNNTYGEMFTSFFKSGIDKSKLDTLPFEINAANDSLLYLQSDLKNIYQISSHPPKYILSLANRINETRSSLVQSQSILPDLPKLLGFTKKVTYLVLLQDHTEIRPTGGFLDSFILATIDNGRLVEQQGYTSELSDSQLHGLVEPPALYKKVTGQSQWYLRDSNWDPDFPTTAQRASWFINKEKSRPVDAVISFNTTILVTLLGKQNYISNYLSQIKPAGSRSSQLLQSFEDYLIAIPKFNKSQIKKLYQTLYSQFATRQAAISPQTFSAPSLVDLGWNGGLNIPSCSGSNCLSDYFYAVDTNLGGNKADAYMSRRHQINVNFSPTKISYSYQLTYQNNSADSSWPAGSYKNYLRVYLSPNQALDQVLINDKQLPNDQYTLTSDHGMTVIGFTIETPVQKISLVELTSHQEISPGSYHYQLSLPSQPGLINYPMELSFVYPADWRVISYQTPSVASVGSLRYNMTLSAPKTFSLDLISNK